MGRNINEACRSNIGKGNIPSTVRLGTTYATKVTEMVLFRSTKMEKEDKALNYEEAGKIITGWYTTQFNKEGYWDQLKERMQKQYDLWADDVAKHLYTPSSAGAPLGGLPEEQLSLNRLATRMMLSFAPRISEKGFSNGAINYRLKSVERYDWKSTKGVPLQAATGITTVEPEEFAVTVYMEEMHLTKLKSVFKSVFRPAIELHEFKVGEDTEKHYRLTLGGSVFKEYIPYMVAKEAVQKEILLF